MLRTPPAVDSPRQPRIVSLLPSATEIVCALGFRDALVGRSHECDFPVGVETLPICTEPRVHPAGTSPEIHREVMTLLRDAVTVYELQIDTLKQLAPEVIVTQTQCDVCAVSLEQVERCVKDVLRPAMEASEGPESEPHLVSLEPTNLAAIWADITRVAEALAVPERGAALVTTLKRRMAAVGARAASLKPRPRVAIIEWIDPPMSGGNWMPELVRLANGENLFGKAGEHSPWLEWDALVKADPDVLLVMPCGFDLEKTRHEALALTERAGWREMKAVREGHVAIADGHQYFNRPGPRLVESLEILVEVLHPKHFDYGHRGKGWEWMKS